MTHLNTLFVMGLIASFVTGQQVDHDRLIDQLGAADATVRDAARNALVAEGAAAVAPLARRLATADNNQALACLAVIFELAPVAGEAISAVRQVMHSLRREPIAKGPSPLAVRLLATLAELIPYRDPDQEVGEREVVGFMVRFEDKNGSLADASMRLRERQAFPLAVDLPALCTAVSARRALHAEVAIERLGRLGATARSAVPVLRAVLDRQEPRILRTGESLPLHRKAAKALLAIAPGSPAAATAHQVLDGTRPAAAPVQTIVPERIRNRLHELTTVLRNGHDAAARAAAIDNLVALGSIAAPALAALLDPTNPESTINDALDLLRRLGRDAASSVPALAVAFRKLPAEHSIAVVRALTATAPWTTDVYFPPRLELSVCMLEIDGQRIAGTVDVDFINSFQAPWVELQMAIAIPGDTSVESLRSLLEDPAVSYRRRAIEIITTRGPECRELVATLTPMVSATHPRENVMEWTMRGTRVATVDRTDQIQRLAATAILAVSPEQHESARAARERLAQPEMK